ncbi:hypothetical protein RHMOL_Rhmol08G0211700 [Rhododendron molle]|uniref:Uncharacterized protein n=1 Tax=Rhododendron molle TaxID=49168 RepID=A0ACC0MS34_RHOML|nr:hypothetical protein RHMOL_Rhmol08G0211700 [Rhododendron molle]
MLPKNTQPSFSSVLLYPPKTPNFRIFQPFLSLSLSLSCGRVRTEIEERGAKTMGDKGKKLKVAISVKDHCFGMSRAALLPKHVAAMVKYQKDPLRALEMFNSVKKEQGFRHNLFSYKCMVEKLGYHGEFEAMEQVFAEMRANIDNCLLEGVYIGAMRHYGRKRKVQEAVDVFERMDFYNCEPSVLSYNAIMNILVENRYFNQAHKVYMRMRDKRIVPDVYTYTIRIKSFCRTKRPHAALRLLKNMPSHGCELNAVAYCTVVGGLYEENLQDEAYELFDEMLRSETCPDVTTFNKLVYTLTKKGDVQQSERLLNKVLKRGVSPNLFTFNIFIQGLCKRGQLKEAAGMVDIVKREGLSPDVVTYNTLICGLSNNCRVSEAENYLQKMVNEGLEPDGFTYNSIIGGYCKMGMVQNADKILNDAVFKGFVPDEFTYCSLMNGLCKDGDVERAMSVFKEALRRGLKPKSIIYNTLIKGLSQQGLIVEALHLMNEMQENGCKPDIWTYNLVINGLCKMSCVLDAHTLMSDAMAKGFLPDIFTFNTLIDGYCKQLKFANAIEILNSMWDHEVTPDVVTYNSVLNGLCKTSKSDDVRETFKVMVEKGCVPNVITYNILMESLCNDRKLVEALSLLDEMDTKGLAPDVVCFGTLMNGSCDNGDVDGAYQLFRRMGQQYKLLHTTATYNIMLNAFFEKLNMGMSHNLFLEMIDNGCPPDNYTYRVMIDGFCMTDNVDSAYNFLLDNIKKGFIPSLTTFGRVINCLCLKHRVHKAVGIVHLMVRKGIVPEIVNTIFEVDKKEVAAPKIVLEDLLKKSHITYYAYELLFDGIRDTKLLKKKPRRSCSKNSKRSSCIDECEAFSTYPRTYGLIHAMLTVCSAYTRTSKLFPSFLYPTFYLRCNAEDILLEMDRILRPEGAVIFCDQVDVLVKVKKLVSGMRWNTKMVDHEDGPLFPEKPVSYYTTMGSQKDYAENLRVASFSAYINSTDDDSFMLKLTGAIPDPILPEVTPRLKSTFVGSKTTEEGEIGVFGADKYFNMKVDYYQTPKALIDHNSQAMIEQEKPKLRAATPSVASDACCNTQTALMPTFSENPPQIKPKTRFGKSCFTGFGFIVPCLDKKSLRINERVEYGMVQRRVVGKDSHRFANPVVFDGTMDTSQSGLLRVPDSVIENFTVGKHLEEARKSIEVFGSQQVTNKKCDIAMNLERKLAMLTWDAIPKSKNIASTLGSGTGPMDDIQSDASSDLFEIETGHPLLTMQLRESHDQISTYEPSEASIEWSVVTASAADYDEKMSIGGETRAAKTKNVVKKEGQKVRSGAGLLGFKSQKVLSIDETAVRANEINAKSMAIGKAQGYSERKEFEFVTSRRSLSSRTSSP